MGQPDIHSLGMSVSDASFLKLAVNGNSCEWSKMMALWSKVKHSYTVALAVLWFFTFDLYTGQLKKGSDMILEMLK